MGSLSSVKSFNENWIFLDAEEINFLATKLGAQIIIFQAKTEREKSFVEARSECSEARNEEKLKDTLCKLREKRVQSKKAGEICLEQRQRR